MFVALKRGGCTNVFTCLARCVFHSHCWQSSCCRSTRTSKFFFVVDKLPQTFLRAIEISQIGVILLLCFWQLMSKERILNSHIWESFRSFFTSIYCKHVCTWFSTKFHYLGTFGKRRVSFFLVSLGVISFREEWKLNMASYTPHGVFHYSLWPSNSNSKKLKPQFSSLSLLGNKNRWN